MSTPASPVAAKAPASAFSYLILDPWIAFSWLIFVFTGLLSVLLLLNPPSPVPARAIVAAGNAGRHGAKNAPPAPAPAPHREVTASQLLSRFLFTGYVFWAWYFGLAAAWRWALARIANLTVSWAGMGCLWGVSIGWLLFAIWLVVALSGGGLFHFFRRWWLLAHGRRPAFLGLENRTERVHARLSELDRLLRNHSITQAEYDRHRDDTLRQL